MFLPRSRKLLSAFSDERLVEQVRRGNDDAFEAIFDRHHRPILSFCRHMLASPDEAEDAVQQTFISAFDALRADARDIKLKAWLYTIARNRCLSILRARREQAAELDDVPTVGLADEVQQRSDLRDLLDDLRELPVDQRAALVLSEIGDLSHAEVGDVVGCEAAKVKSLVFQARSSLIETRRARDIPCSEIREQLATATGGGLRRAPLRRHVRACTGCAEFRDQVMRQRKALAMILPVVPSLGLKKSALAAIGLGGGGGAGGAAAGLSGGGGIASLASSGVAAKVVGAVVVAGVAVGGGLVLDKSSPAPPAQAAEGPNGGPAHAAQAAQARAAGPGANVHLTARHGSLQRTAAKQRGHHGAGTRAQTRSGGGGSTKHPGTGGGGQQHVTQNTPTGQTGPGMPASQAPSAAPTPVGPPANSNAGGNGNGNGGGNGGGAQNNSGNHTGWDHSAHGGQGVGQGGDPPGAAPTTANGNGNANASPPANSNAGGNGKEG